MIKVVVYGFPAVPDAFASLLVLGVQYFIDIYVGFTVKWDFADQLDNTIWVSAELALNLRLATEIVQKYGMIDGFARFNIPYEILQASSFNGQDSCAG